MSGRVVVLGGSGFLGSHLCDQLLTRGDEVVCVDNLSTGRRANVAHLDGNPGFALVEADISEGIPVDGEVTGVCNLASPASPPDYLALPLETLAVGSEGTRQGLEFAERNGARFLMASTSEVYGDPDVHPQSETYWGNVNPVGPRSVYDEAKRFSEALTMAHHRTRGTDVAIVRIFNTYGPRLRPDDGRVVSNFLLQAMRGEPLTVYGDGSQTRSLCYVEDEVRGLLALFDSGLTGPVNIGNPDEYTVLQLARRVIDLLGSSSVVEHRPLPTDDPTRRRPDITVARTELGWEPTTSLEEGLSRTAAYLVEEAGRPDRTDPGFVSGIRARQANTVRPLVPGPVGAMVENGPTPTAGDRRGARHHA
jgi:dTDP-glucose 4,6-dehydratase